ncbi:hypothetical protein LR68_04432 [Anoxybacillus sp. BCO1]|nr:hypothetical protein LR68_04432 [Anoxybacillus sp. BCO1]
MKVLAIDTSTFVMGIAVVDGQIVKGEIITNLKKIIRYESCLRLRHCFKNVT